MAALSKLQDIGSSNKTIMLEALYLYIVQLDAAHQHKCESKFVTILHSLGLIHFVLDLMVFCFIFQFF